MTIELLKTFLMWNVFINFVLFVFTAMMSAYGRGFIYKIHSKIFGIQEETINAMLYGFLALYKVVFFVFALVPWLSLLIVAK